MNFIFTCPVTHKTFETDAFRVIEDNGVRMNPSGQKVWQARIELSDPCPICGDIHIYHPQDLPCPFTTPGA